MRIQHNIPSMNAYRNYNNNNKALSGNLEKLSSGYKINRAGDDAAGLAISEKMRAQITGLNAAQKNVKDGISLVKTAEGAMQEIHDMLNRMDYLATQSANGTYDNEVDRANLQKEVESLKTEINRIADSANFNGIKLLDGSMDSNAVQTVVKDSAISEITTNNYAAKGASDAFTAQYIINRPEAATQQTNAQFVLDLDDFAFSGVSTNDIFELTVGDAKITYKAEATIPADTKALAAKLAQCGSAIQSGKVAASADGATEGKDAGGTKTDTDTWNASASTKALGTSAPTANNKYVKIDGHWWEMSADGTDTKITFKQVDFMANGSDPVTPDYSAKLELTDKTTTTTSPKATLTGTCNWKAQDPVTGIALGSSQQAQVSVGVDFSKLKEGDRLIVGEKTYVFGVGKDTKIGKDDTGTSLGGTQTADGAWIVDLSDIFKEESDLADETKQAKAMVQIVSNMTDAGSVTWSIGNGGVVDGKGTLTFQSLSSYSETTPENIADNANNGICDMTTEANVMKQFYSERPESGASVEFNLDVTKIKVGDTFILDGKTFEFTDGEASSTKNAAIDLSDLGVANGLLSSQTGDVLDRVKTAIEGELKHNDSQSKYTVTTDVNKKKVTISSNDNGDTQKTFENRVAGKLELPTESTSGKGLTLQIGDTSDKFNQLTVNIGDMHTKAMGSGKTTLDGKEVEVTKTIADIDIGNQEGAAEAVAVIKNAINYVSSVRGDLGAVQNRLDHTANNLSVMAENIQDAESTIRDTDVAEEMMSYVKNNILVQSAQAMLAQANQLPQGVLQLLG